MADPTIIVFFSQQTVDPVASIEAAIGPTLLIMSLIAPFLLAFLTRWVPDKEARKALGVVAAVVAAGVSIIIDQPDEVTVHMLITRIVAAWPLVEGTYRASMGALAIVSPTAKAFLNGEPRPDPDRYSPPRTHPIKYND